MDAADNGNLENLDGNSLLTLMKNTGYSMIQENGQRKFGGPPPDWEGPPPPRGCEVFVGKIPRDMFEDELVPLFESAGRIYAFRLMMEFSGENRGYAFVMYATKEAAQRAINLLDNYEIRPGKFIGVCISLDNCRLFIGSIPKDKNKEEIQQEIMKVTDGVVDVIVYPSAMDKTKNRGFAFVEYESHKAAALARRKLIPGTFQLWGHSIQVDWAEPEKVIDEETMQRVRILYVRNLMLHTTEETLLTEFSRLNPGSVERVKKLSDYAFIHFYNREDAIAAKQVMNGQLIDGSSIEVTLAKPVSKESSRRAETRASHNVVGRLSFDVTPELSLCSGTMSDLSSVHSLSLSPNLGILYPIFPEPGMYPYQLESSLVPTSLRSLKPSQFTSSVLLLDYFCQKRGWSLPEYYLYSLRDHEDTMLLIYKVLISSIQSIHMADKACLIVDDAKELAAQTALANLDLLWSPSSPGSYLSPASPCTDPVAFQPVPCSPYPMMPFSPPMPVPGTSGRRF